MRPYLLAALLCAAVGASGCASINEANRAAAQEDAVLDAWDKAAEEAGE